MWLFGDEDYVTEVGTMNQFFYWINEDGEKELVTPPLDGTILPGVTRDTLLSITREWNEFKVSERPFRMDDVIKVHREGRILEAFGSGTAAIVCPVDLIGYNGNDYVIPLDPARPGEKSGPLARRIYETITDIQYGVTPHKWSVPISGKDAVEKKKL